MRALFLTLALAAPAAADTGQVVRDLIRPGFAAFAEAAGALAGIDGCEAEVLRPAFQSAWDARMGVAHLAPGPAEEDGRGPAVLYWPDPKALGWKAQKALLSGDAAALEPSAFAQQSVAARGLPGQAPLLCEPPEGAAFAMQGYAGSVAATGERVIVTSPKGGAAMIFAGDGAHVATHRRADLCGAAAH